MAEDDDENPLPSLQAPAQVTFDRASNSAFDTGAHSPVAPPFAPISSSPILVSGVHEPAESSRSIASAVPVTTRNQRSLPVGHGPSGGVTGGPMPLRSVVLVAAGIIVALILLSLLLFR